MVISNTDSNLSTGRFIDKNGEFDFTVKIRGYHNLECLGFAIAAARECGLSCDEIGSVFQKESDWCVRGKTIQFCDYAVFDDSYNASVESIIADIDMLKQSYGNNISVALGDIYELGTFTEKIHRQVGYTVAKRGVNKMYLYGVYARFIKEGALLCGMDERKIFTNSDLSAPYITAENICTNHEKNEIILMKASHAVNMGTLLQYLKNLESKK